MSHTVAPCQCVVDHRPGVAELDIHHIHPLALGGPDTPENRIVQCPNGHRNVHELLREYKRYGGKPPWSVRRRYSAFTRALAADGWARYEASR